MLRALIAGNATGFALLILAGGAAAAAPTFTGYSSVSGDSTAIGNTLTADNSHVNWTGSPTFTYQWLRCNIQYPPGYLGTCAPIDGATDPTYQLAAADGGHIIVVDTTATNADGSIVSRAQTSGVVGAPRVVSWPEITGDTSAIGATLSVSNGSWIGSPTGFAYEWRRCTATMSACTSIDGATSQTYTIVADDAGSRLMAIVHAIGASFTGYTYTTSETIGQPAFHDDWPSIEGDTSSVGNVLTVTNGTLYGSPTSYAYQWYRCPASYVDVSACSSLDGATSKTYTTVDADLGHSISASVTASNAAGSATATGYGLVIGAPAGGFVSLTGQHSAVGDTLTVSTDGWKGSPTSFEWDWSRCDLDYMTCSGVLGHGTTYTLTSDDIGKHVFADLTVTNAIGSSYGGAEALGGSPSPQSGQAMTGTLTVGSTLTAEPGTWVGSPTSFAYQWRQCNVTLDHCTDITGATSSTYTVAAADLGKTLEAAITATNAVGPYEFDIDATEPVHDAAAAPAPAPASEPAPTSGSGGGGGGSSAPAAPSKPAIPSAASASAAPGKAGSVQSQSATVSWQPRSIDGQATVALAPLPDAMLQPLGSSPAVDLTVTASDGTAITAFAEPVQLVFAKGDATAMPAYSLDGKTWLAIPKLANTTLAQDEPDGWYLDADGNVAILTRHATFFALLPKTAALMPELSVSTSRSAGKLRINVRSSLPGTAVAVLRRGSTVLARGKAVLQAAGSGQVVLRAPRGHANLTVVMRSGGRQAFRVVAVG